MSLHIAYDHQCSQCKAPYIPYNKGIVCPNCECNEDDLYDIVPRITNLAKQQMKMHGFYTPIAWWSGSLGDRVALLIFKVLDAYDEQDKQNFEEFAQEYFNSIRWNNQLYLKHHIYELSCKVYLDLLDKKSV